MNKITYLGSEKEIREAAKRLKKHRKLGGMKEGKARLEIQRLIDKHNLKASIILNGNIVWSKRRILANLDRIMRHGILYNRDQSKPVILSQYFYQFLHQVCGSVAHYDIQGWIHCYPTVEHLREFFKKNELGKRVLDWIPAWHTDARLIVEEIEKKLYPFQTYMRTRNHNQ